MRKNVPALARVLVIEGQVTPGNTEHLESELKKADLYHYARRTMVLGASELVVGEYRVAASWRQVEDGVNVNEDSVSRFRKFAQTSCDMADSLEGYSFELNVAKALYLHNAASAYASHNGNKPEVQLKLNKLAYELLSLVHEDYRGPAWWVVRTKVGVGLMESGAIDFNEGEYVKYINFMRDTEAKDFAGRVEYYVRWLVNQGKLDSAGELINLWVIADDTWSAPNQVERLRQLAAELGVDIDTDDNA